MRRRMIITTILLSLLLIAFLLFIGGLSISFHPFSIEFTRLYNMLGWLCIIACGIFFSLDNRIEQQKHYAKELEKIPRIFSERISQFNRGFARYTCHDV